MPPRFRASIPPSLAALAVCDSIVLLGCFSLAAAWIEPTGFSFYLLYEGGLLQGAVAVAAIQVTLYFERLYETMPSLGRALQQVCLALGVAFLLQAMLAYSRSPAETPRAIMIGGSLAILAVFPAWRLTASAVLSKGVPQRRLLFLGAPSDAAGTLEEIAQLLKRQPEIGFTVLGYLGDKSGESRVPCLGGMNDFDLVFQEFAPSRIVIQRRATGLPMRRLLELQRLGARIEEFSRLYESLVGRISALEMAPGRLIFSRDLDARRGAAVARDVYSVLAGCLLLILVSPLLALAAISIKSASRGPVFEREDRIGIKGARISLFRFRRISIAKRLRDLPLLINVALGDLALVGPAPERPEFARVLREHIPFYGQRLSVKPGLTGWAQVHRDVGQMPESIAALEYDLYYIKHLSPAIDLYVLLLQCRKWLSVLQ